MYNNKINCRTIWLEHFKVSPFLSFNVRKLSVTDWQESNRSLRTETYEKTFERRPTHPHPFQTISTHYVTPPPSRHISNTYDVNDPFLSWTFWAINSSYYQVMEILVINFHIFIWMFKISDLLLSYYSF